MTSTNKTFKMSNNKLKKLLNLTIKKRLNYNPLKSVSNGLLNQLSSPSILEHTNNLKQLNSIPELNENYEFKEFLGSGSFGNIYKIQYKQPSPPLQKQSSILLLSNNLVCKVIKLSPTHKQNLLQELNILNILMSHINVNQYIIPYTDYIFHKNKAYVFFNNIDCYTVKDIYPILNYILKTNLYNNIIKYIVKHILKSISTIHSVNIAHQNLDNSSILISKNLENIKNENDILDIQIKIVDFSLSCGLLENNNNNQTIKCLDNSNYFTNSTTNSTTPPTLLLKTNNLISNNKSYDALKLAKEYDTWCCGKVLYELLHHNQPKIKKTISQILENDNSWYDDFKLSNSLTSATAYTIRSYNDIIEKYMLVPIIKRKPVNLVLEKILLLEKY